MYRGEYLEYTAVSPIVLRSYTLSTISPGLFNQSLPPNALNGLTQASSDSILGPDEVVLLGSQDGQRWKLLNQQTGLSTQWANQLQITVNVDNTNSYPIYRWVFPKLCRQTFAESSDKGILLTDLSINSQEVTVFPEGITSRGDGLIFVQVSDYPAATREYTGTLVTYLEPQSGGGGGSVVLIIVIVLLLLIIAGVIGALIYFKKIPSFKKSSVPEVKNISLANVKRNPFSENISF